MTCPYDASLQDKILSAFCSFSLTKRSDSELISKPPAMEAVYLGLSFFFRTLCSLCYAECAFILLYFHFGFCLQWLALPLRASRTRVGVSVPALLNGVCMFSLCHRGDSSRHSGFNPWSKNMLRLVGMTKLLLSVPVSVNGV